MNAGDGHDYDDGDHDDVHHGDGGAAAGSDDDDGEFGGDAAGDVSDALDSTGNPMATGKHKKPTLGELGLRPARSRWKRSTARGRPCERSLALTLQQDVAPPKP